MAKDYTQVNFRIPTSLKEKIDKAALMNDQSITAEIVARLEQSFTPKSLEPSPEMLKYKDEVDAQTKTLQENLRASIELNEKQAKILEELKEFQVWRNQQKKPT